MLRLFQIILTTLLTLLCVAGYAQISNLTAFDGTPIKENRYPNVKGSPWLVDAWLDGEVWGEGEQRLKNVKLRYDEYADDVVLFREGKSFRLNPATIRGFVVYVPESSDLEAKPYVYKNGYPEVDNNSKNTFYRVLYEGKKAVFLYRTKVELFENAPTYGSAVNETSFVRKKRYYVYKDGKMHPVLLNKKDILNALNDKAAEAYAAKNKMKLKKEEEIIQLMAAVESM